MQHAVVALQQWGIHCRGRQESVHLFQGQSFGKACAAFGCCDGAEGVVWDQILTMQIGKETFQGRKSSCIAAMGDVPAATMFQKNVDNLTVDLRKGIFLLLVEEV